MNGAWEKLIFAKENILGQYGHGKKKRQLITA
jgi:hypothetical protein